MLWGCKLYPKQLLEYYFYLCFDAKSKSGAWSQWIYPSWKEEELRRTYRTVVIRDSIVLG